MTLFLDWTKFKAFADEKLNVAKFTNSVSDRAENIMGIGENAGYQTKRLFFSGLFKVGIVW